MNGDRNMKEQVLRLLDNREFCDKLLEIENENEVKEHFKKNGVEITDEELSEIKEFISAMEKELKKLDNDVLKEISGGVGSGKKKKRRGNIAITETTDSATTQQGHTMIDRLNDFSEAVQILSECGSKFKGGLDYAFGKIGGFLKSQGDNELNIVRAQQQGETERYRMGINAIMGLAITGAIAGGVYANRRRICKWIFGN